jgi:hypothetical protein
MYRFGDVFTCDSYEFIDGEGYYYKNCILIKVVGEYRLDTLFDYVWFDMSELKLWFCMFDGDGYIMNKHLTTID